MSDDLAARVAELERERDVLIAALAAQVRRIGARNGDILVARCENADDAPTMRKLAEFLIEKAGIEALIVTMPLDKDITQLDRKTMAEAGWYRTDD